MYHYPRVLGISLDLRWCDNLTSIPTSLHSLSHLKIPLRIAGVFPIPLDVDWSEFKREVNVVSYVKYMIRMNKISSIFSDLVSYMKRFDSEEKNDFKGYELSSIYGLISRREGRGNGLIGYLCLMLTNDWKMKRERGYMNVNEIMEWRKDEKKRDGMSCLRILFMNVYGMEMKQDYRSRLLKLVSIGRRMREVWKEEGKEDSEGRREWERKWREVGDIIMEEDMIQIFHLYLCIKAPADKNLFKWNVPSECSKLALSALRYEGMGYHFKLCTPSVIPQFSVLIRITHWDNQSDDDRMKCSLLQTLGRRCEGGWFEWIYSSECRNTPYVVVKMASKKDARLYVERMNKGEHAGVRFSIAQGKRS